MFTAMSLAAEDAKPAATRRTGRGFKIDFAAPKGDPGLIAPGSVSWRVNANPEDRHLRPHQGGRDDVRPRHPDA